MRARRPSGCVAPRAPRRRPVRAPASNGRVKVTGSGNGKSGPLNRQFSEISFKTRKSIAKKSRTKRETTHAPTPPMHATAIGHRYGYAGRMVQCGVCRRVAPRSYTVSRHLWAGSLSVSPREPRTADAHAMRPTVATHLTGMVRMVTLNLLPGFYWNVVEARLVGGT